VDRSGLRRKLLKAQAEAGDIVLLFGDESEALTHPYLAHAWAKQGADLRIPAPGQAAKVAMLGVLDWAPRELVVCTSRTKRSTDFIALLEELDRRYGPKPGVTLKPTVLTLDNGPIHTSKATRAALAERAHWLTIEWLPKYAPELNDIEEVWRDLKQHHLAHQTFTGTDDLKHGIHHAVAKLNTERKRHPLDSQRIAARHPRSRAKRTTSDPECPAWMEPTTLPSSGQSLEPGRGSIMHRFCRRHSTSALTYTRIQLRLHLPRRTGGGKCANTAAALKGLALKLARSGGV